MVKRMVIPTYSLLYALFSQERRTECGKLDDALREWNLDELKPQEAKYIECSYKP